MAGRKIRELARLERLPAQNAWHAVRTIFGFSQ